MFYDNLKYLCDKNNTTPTTVIKQLGLSTGSITNWKKGITPTGDIIMRFAEHFDVSADFLLTGVEDKSDECTSLSTKELLNYYNHLSETEQNIILHKTAELYYERMRQEELKKMK